MKTIATLGPQGTFSSAATAKYMEKVNDKYEVMYYSSIKSVLQSIGRTCDYGVLPVENFSEGYVSPVLDFLIAADLSIVAEILLPIQFSFVSSEHDIDDIENVYVQFVAKGQCSEFLESLHDVKLITTESNIESLGKAVENRTKSGAVVPSHSVHFADFDYSVENINDYKNNQTRFLVLAASKNHIECEDDYNKSKTTIIVLDDDDHPGLLESILSSFSKREINLTSIVSRPTRRSFGKYHFFIDFEGALNNDNVSEALHEISYMNKVKVLGSYKRL